MPNRITLTPQSRKPATVFLPCAALLAALILTSAPAKASVVFMEDFEDGTMNNWTTVPLTSKTPLDNSTAQARRGTHSALEDNVYDYMYHNLGIEQSGAFRASFWIYDGTGIQAYGEVRGYPGAGWASSGVQQVFAVGKYNTVTLSGEVYDATKYQARVLYPSAVGGWFNLNAAGAPSRSTGWHKFVIERLADGSTLNFYVDGVLSRTIAGASNIDMDCVLIGAGNADAAATCYFDDVLFEDSTGGFLGTINTQPTSQTKDIGQSVSFSASASDGGNPAYLTYQWKKGSSAISGATDSAYTFTVAADSGGDYTVDVMGAFGTNTSSVAVLIVGTARTWVGLGGNDNWSTSANWQEGALGLTGFAVHFDGSTRTTPNMENNYSVLGIEFQPTAASFTVGATAGKTLTDTGAIIQNSPNPQTLSLPISLSGSQTFNTSAGDLSVGGVISGTGAGLTKAGSYTLTLSAPNTYDGATTISAGTLKLGNSQVLPNGAGKGNVSLAGTLDLGGFDQTVNGLSGAGVVDSSGSTGITNILTVGNNGVSSSFSGTIKNSVGDKVGWTKIGTGTFTLSGSHAYSGDTTLSAGTVSMNASTFFGDESGALRLSGGNLLLTASHPSTTSFANPVVMTANTTLKSATSASGNWYMRFSSEYLTFTGGTLTVTNQGTGVFDIQFQTVKGVSFARPIVLYSGTKLELCNEDKINDTVVAGPITGAGQVNYTSWNDGTGGNTLAMNANNTYSGGSFLTGGLIGFGANSVGSPGALTSGPIGTGSLTVNNDGYLGLLAWGGPRTVGNAIVLNTLSDANDLHIDGTNDLTLTGTISLGNSNRTVRVANTGVTTFAGVISGGAAGKTLTKAGPGKLVFSGNNTYTIPTTVTEGTLLVNNTAGSGTGSGALTVNPGAILGGTGKIAGAVSASGATVAPGTSAGRLTFQAGLDLTSGIEEWELAANSANNPGTDFDQIALTGGTLALANATLKIMFTNSATVPDLGNAFWQYPRQWKVVSLSGSATNPGDSNFATIDGTNGITAGTFTTTLDSTGVTLVYTPSVAPPPPTRVTSMTMGPASGSSCAINYSGGTGAQFVLMKTNALTSPITSRNGWSRVATNSSGTGTFTIPVGPDPKAFYYIQSE